MIGLQDEGALIAVAGHRHAAHLAALGLRALGHRARAGVGIAAADGSAVRGARGAGAVDEILGQDVLDSLPGTFAIGRVTGAPEVDAARVAPAIDEPVVRAWKGGRMGVASAGRLANGRALRQQILGAGGALFGESDAELVAAHVARQEGRTLVNRFVAALHDLHGAWCIAIVAEDRLIIARDPRGFRPLVRGRLDVAYVFASEDTALRDLGCSEIQPVRAGEVVIVDRDGARSIRPFLPIKREASLVDLVWLAREDARVEGESASEIRLTLGRTLAEVHPAPSAAVVVGLPEAPSCAIGFAEAARRPYRVLAPGAALSPFMQEGSSPVRAPGRYRAAGVAGQEVALILPGLVTAIEAGEAVEALRGAGATRVHVRVAAPLPVEPDPYGVAMPPPEAWVAEGETGSQTLADRLSADSAGTLDLAALRSAVASWEQGWCDALWSGVHPVPIDERSGQLDLF